jgi:hypothetical protein
MAMTNDFDKEKLSELGFLIKEATSEYLVLEDKDSENEIIEIWKLGDWLQFRCDLFDIGATIGSSKYIALSETINRLHNRAMGARVALSDAGEIVLVTDVLRSAVDSEVAADMANQLLWLAEKLVEPLERLARGQSSLSEADIDRLFEEYRPTVAH